MAKKKRHTDLAKVNALIEEGQELLNGNPALQERTKEELGRLEANTATKRGGNKLESATGEVQISLRLPKKLLEWADELAEAMQDHPRLLAWQGPPTRSAVLRLALGLGLEALQRQVED